MRLLLLAVLLLLGSCFTFTQESIKADGSRYERRSQNPPYRAASCVARNLETIWDESATVREATQAGSHEVTMRTGTTGNIVAYAIAVPSDTGSRITLWLTPKRIGPDDLDRKALSGC